MKNILAITERETKAYFLSPMAYVLMAMFLFISGFIYVAVILYSNQADMRIVIMNMSVTLLFLCPIITMRLFAEERRTGTIEVLLTSPVSDMEAVLGKFFGAMAMYLVMLILTIHYPLFLLAFGTPDRGPLLCSYIGLLFLGACYLSLGVLASTMARNQIVAAVVGFGFILILWLLSASADFFSPPINDIMKYLSFFDHFQDFTQGVIDSKHLIFYFSFIGFMLFLAVFNIRNKKWR